MGLQLRPEEVVLQHADAAVAYLLLPPDLRTTLLLPPLHGALVPLQTALGDEELCAGAVVEGLHEPNLLRPVRRHGEGRCDHVDLGELGDLG